MTANKTASAYSVAGTDDYPERPLEEALADPEDLKTIENRAQTDQIVDYHKDHPTMVPNEPEAEDLVVPLTPPPETGPEVPAVEPKS